MSQHTDLRDMTPVREDHPPPREDHHQVSPSSTRHRPSHDGAMGLREVLDIARRSWIIVAVTLVVALVAAWIVTALTPDSYDTESKVLVSSSVTATSTTGTSAGNTVSLVVAQMPTFAALATTPVVLDPAIEQSGVDIASTELVPDVSADVIPGTSIITISVTADAPRDAAELANAIAASLISRIQSGNTVDNPVQISGSVVQAPVIPRSPSSPDLLLNLVVALAAGLLVALLVVVVRQALAASTRPS